MRRTVGLLAVLTVVAFVVLFVVGPLQEPACASQATSARVELRVLLVSVDGEDATTTAWRDLLVDEGVPHAEVHLGEGGDVDDELLYAPDGSARFQAIVLADSHLAEGSRPDLPSLLDSGARRAVAGYQRDVGARVVAATIVPDADLPLTVSPAPSDLDGLVAEVTDDGAAVFPYLQGEVPIEGAFGFVPTAGAGVTALVALPDGRPMVAVVEEAGAETLYVAPQVSIPVLHWRLLRHGLLGWATRGMHLGVRQYHYAMHVDDVFLPNFRWDPAADRTSVELGTSQMAPEDVAYAADWMLEHDLRLDIVYNAAGRSREMCDALLAEKAAFGWTNHTYAHRDLDALSEAELVEEIELNRRWAENHDLPGFNGDELVTGAHTGLANPAMPDALREAGIRWIAADQSRDPEQRRIGDALTVPRYPTDIYYDASTRIEQLDEYDFVYRTGCDPAVTRCREDVATWEEFVDIQGDIMFRHIIDGDPRIHYTHQSNMTDDRVLYEPLERMLEEFRRLIDAPLLQPTLTESGEELRRRDRWADAIEAGAVEAWSEGDELHVRSTEAIEMPVTGVGAPYAGERMAWIALVPGEELILPF